MKELVKPLGVVKKIVRIIRDVRRRFIRETNILCYAIFFN